MRAVAFCKRLTVNIKMRSPLFWNAILTWLPEKISGIFWKQWNGFHILKTGGFDPLKSQTTAIK